MDRPVLMAIVLVFLLLLLALMVLGWRARARRQVAIGKPASVPELAGAELVTAPVFYVATTVATEPLNRIAVSGLGFRSRATVSAAEAGITLTIPGQYPSFIPASDVRAVERATATIDRVVERGGMVLVRWVLRSDSGLATEVDSYLRFIEPEDSNKFCSVILDNYLHHSTERGRAL